MTLNKIDSKCPKCDCTTADVLCKTFEGNEKKGIVKVIVKCIDRNHQYTLDPDGKNSDWKQFFTEK